MAGWSHHQCVPQIGTKSILSKLANVHLADAGTNFGLIWDQIETNFGFLMKKNHKTIYICLESLRVLLQEIVRIVHMIQ